MMEEGGMSIGIHVSRVRGDVFCIHSLSSKMATVVWLGLNVAQLSEDAGRRNTENCSSVSSSSSSTTDMVAHTLRPVSVLKSVPLLGVAMEL